MVTLSSSYKGIIMVNEVMITGPLKITILLLVQQVKRQKDIMSSMEEEQQWFMGKTGILIMRL
jgi:hypothetical protein